MTHYQAAMGKAADANAQAMAARAAANRAAAARTNATAAAAQASAAEAAAARAATARGIAETAKSDAHTAYMNAMGAETSDDAEMYRDQAVAANVIATAQHTGANGAGMNYMTARDANAAARTAADTHVLGLLLAANVRPVWRMWPQQRRWTSRPKP